MSYLKYFTSICFLTLAVNTFAPVQTQMMPEYDDYPQRERGGMDGLPPRERGGMDDYPEPPGGGDDYPEGDPDYPGPGGPDRMSRRRDPYGRGGRRGGREVARKNEVVVGRKRFKLYEKKRMNFKRAKEFCKKKDGKLAEAKTIEEMRRLETLFARARMLGMDVWVNSDKKKWKKHSMKEVTHPGLNLDKAGMEKSGIKASLVGGGMKEMCPAISLSTRNIGPVQCAFPLPFICEYDRDRPRTTRKPKRNSTDKPDLQKKVRDLKKKLKNRDRDEMKK